MSVKRLITALLALFVIAGQAIAANPKREMRSSWLTTVTNIDWPTTKGTSASAQAAQKKELLAYLDKFEEWNMTGTCLHIRSMADAMYPSKYAPWSSYLTGTRGADPGWDPLAYFIEECHKRGLEAYVWLNPYRWKTSGASWSTAMDKEWLEKDMIISNDAGNFYTFNPALPETQELFINVIKEVVSNYDIDGLLFDDYFYPGSGTTESSSAPDYDDYKASGTTLSIGDWRRANVNKMVKDCYETIKSLRPDVRFGIGPAGVSNKSASKYGLPSQSSYGSSASDWQYAQIYADPLTWMYEGTIDFISPQLYWETTHSTNGYAALTHWWSDVAEILNCHCYISQASYKVTNSGWGIDEIIKQVKINRQYAKNNNCGAIYYNSNTLKSYCSKLADDVYSTKALSPEITWKSGKSYEKVANLTYNNGTLTWDATTNGNAIIRYTVYAVPIEVSLNNAMSADGDGIDGKYLQKVVYGTSYTVDTDKQNNYWYAVCVFDGYSKEHAIALANYADGESKATTLIAPINGATAQWEATFSWNAVENATYRIEISDTQDFSNVLVSQRNITTTSVVLDLGTLESSKTHYWRVFTAEPSKLEAASEVATFTTTTRPTGPSATLISPDNGAEIEDEIYFSWSAAGENVDYYTLEVSADNNFSTIKYTNDIPCEPDAANVSHEILASLVGKGTFYWRVATKGGHINPGYSEVRSFTVTKLSVGDAEPGYMWLRDKDSYENVGDMSVESVWHRAVGSDYGNISFGESGSFNRSFVAKDGYVYMSGRASNSSSASIYLRKFSGETGEIMSDIILSSNGAVSYYPCNDVVKDSEGNVCISNLTLNASSTPLKVHSVDLETGNLTEIASITTSKLSSPRIDHIAVTGDVTSGNYVIWAAVRATKSILRWTYTNGSMTNEEVCTLKSLYPTTASNFDSAPRVKPLTDDLFFVDGSATAWTLYSFSTGNVVSSFTDNPAIAPSAYFASGGTFFTLNEKNYMVYSSTDTYDDTNPHSFNVVSTNSDMSFASAQLLWTLPKAGLGGINSQTMQANADWYQVDNNTVRLFLFTPGNGLCAYDITDNSLSGVESVFGAEFCIKAKGRTIVMSDVAEMVTVYNMMGAKVAQAGNVAELKTNLESGIYLVTTVADGKTYTQKLVIK